MAEELPFSVPARHEAGVQTLLLAKRVLDSLSVSFWLSHGSLLGAIRDNDLISHDSDIDLGIWDDEIADHNSIRQALIAAGFSPAVEFGFPGSSHQYAFWSPYGVYVDLFFYCRDQQRCWMSIWTPSGPRKMIFPLPPQFATFPLFGELFKIPVNYEDWLRLNYGDWKTPVPPVERGGSWHYADSPLNYEKAGGQ